MTVYRLDTNPNTILGIELNQIIPTNTCNINGNYVDQYIAIVRAKVNKNFENFLFYFL